MTVDNKSLDSYDYCVYMAFPSRDFRVGARSNFFAALESIEM